MLHVLELLEVVLYVVGVLEAVVAKKKKKKKKKALFVYRC